MLVSRLLFSAYLKNGVAYRVGRRALASEANSHCSSAGSKEQLKNRAGGSTSTSNYIFFVYRDDNGKLELSPLAQKMDEKAKKKLSICMNKLKTPDFKLGDALVIPDVEMDGKTYEAVILACAGPKDAKVNNTEGLNEAQENARCSIGAGYKAMALIKADSCTHDTNDDVDQAAEESSLLSAWLQTSVVHGPPARAMVLPTEKGKAFGMAQNVARYLSQLPMNKMTPDGVVEEAKGTLTKVGVKVTSYDKTEIKKKNMHAFLAVAQGSSAAPKLLECDYKTDDKAPLVLMVAKGVTFDSGGLCLKKREDMLMHSGMTGAAAALGALWGLAQLKTLANVKLVVPLCENMISGECLKVGDVVPTAKGDEVKVEDTDLEGHLMLADALTYGQAQYKPHYIMSVASLTPGITEATGGGCYGCFSKRDDMWKIAYDAGSVTGDRPWRFPIWDFYRRQIKGDPPPNDIFSWKNRGSGTGSHCVGASFLDNFITDQTCGWLHYDITGVGKMAPGEAPTYLNPNYMTGRPTRALLQALITISGIIPPPPPPPPPPENLCLRH